MVKTPNFKSGGKDQETKGYLSLSKFNTCKIVIQPNLFVISLFVKRTRYVSVKLRKYTQIFTTVSPRPIESGFKAVIFRLFYVKTGEYI